MTAEWAAVTETGPQNLKHLLSGPLQKKFANPCTPTLDGRCYHFPSLKVKKTNNKKTQV